MLLVLIKPIIVVEFHGIEKWLLLKALRTLETNRKAEVIGDDGVKFFWVHALFFSVIFADPDAQPTVQGHDGC